MGYIIYNNTYIYTNTTYNYYKITYNTYNTTNNAYKYKKYNCYYILPIIYFTKKGSNGHF